MLGCPRIFFLPPVLYLLLLVEMRCCGNHFAGARTLLIWRSIGMRKKARTPADKHQVNTRIVAHVFPGIAGANLKDHRVMLRAVLQAMAIAVAGFETGAIAGLQDHLAGVSKAQIARQLNIGRISVRRILATYSRKK